MESAKPEKKIKSDENMLLTQWLLKTATRTISFHTSGNKRERADRCKSTEKEA